MSTLSQVQPHTPFVTPTTPHVTVSSRYMSLSIIAFLWKCTAILAFAVLLGCGFILATRYNELGNTALVFLGIMAGALYYALHSFARAELIQVSIDMEQNSRQMVQAQQELVAVLRHIHNL